MGRYIQRRQLLAVLRTLLFKFCPTMMRALFWETGRPNDFADNSRPFEVLSDILRAINDSPLLRISTPRNHLCGHTASKSN